MTDQKIGKYRILELIGRGGMGMIYKAHDPVLDRLVALKVISPEVEVTDELKARFFREAQACAKLNHPNIVTVYDLGEDEGRLFIVMELLEGQELRRLVVPGTPLTLEDKLSVMMQVCGGLHYAHQQGIVHRDMKPGNVFLLGNGRVKILDFGIAHMASTETGLTRTGLIMGTLRYISPEQVQGRADHRSDMFSIGSVFYELLTLRPAFAGDDPMHLLEQLRTDDPPPPSDLDAGIPTALTAIVQRAMRKNPSERFRDLEEMRGELEDVQRRVTEERHRAGARVRGQRERLVQLQGKLAERLGALGEDEDVPPIDERKGLVAIQALEQTFAERIRALEGKIVQADAVAPAAQRADALLQAGRFEEAAAQFEAIVADAPEYRHGRQQLEWARAAAEAQRQGRRASELGEKARAALHDGRYALCLEIVKEATELPLPADVAEELASLRARALAEQESLRRRRQEAEAASTHSTTAREAAQAEDAERYAPEPWNEAQALMAEADASLRRDAYAEAQTTFERAGAAYQRAQAGAGQARVEERRAAERAREAATQEQQRARAADAAQYARGLWEAAEVKFGEGQAAFATPTAGRGRVPFTDASGLYRRAEDAAREARAGERRRAEAARERAAEGRRSAAALDVERRVPSLWQDAIGKSTTGEAAWVREQYARAADAFEAALALYHHAQAQVRELARRQREEGGRKQQQVAEGRRRAEAAEAAAHAATEWAEAEASAGAAEAALERRAWEEASAGLDRAVVLYRLAEERARETLQACLEAEKAGEDAEAARRGAVDAGAARYADEPWQGAETAHARAVAAVSRHQYAAARGLFGEAGRQYVAARNAAEIAATAATRRDTGTSPLESTEPVGKATVVVDPQAATVPAPTLTFVDAGLSSAAAPRVEDTVTPRWPEAPWYRQPLALMGGLIGLAAILIVVVAFHRRESTSPPPSARAAASVGATEQRGNTERPPRDDAARAGVEQTDTDRQLPPRPNAGAIRSGLTPNPDRTSKHPAARVERTEPTPPASTSVPELTILAARVQTARRMAEQAAAGYWVPESFASARDKEQLAGTARARSDYAAAVKLFGQAESEYRAAAQQARIDAEAESKIAPLKERVKESRASTVAQRTEAVTAQAGRLAKDAFDAAEATHREADALDRRQDFVAAARAYEAAAAQYRGAASRAQAVRESRPAGESTHAP